MWKVRIAKYVRIAFVTSNLLSGEELERNLQFRIIAEHVSRRNLVNYPETTKFD